MYIEVNNIKINYEVFGDGKPIILLNPNSVNTNSMSYIAKELSKEFKVYLFDRRCCGKSEKDCVLTYEESAKDVIEFINKLNIEKPYLLGSSGGATVALKVAIQSPDIISKLICCSGVARIGTIQMPMYTKLMEKLPFYPGKKEYEMFKKLNSEAKEITINELNKIQVPTLIVNGGKKDIVSTVEAEYISKGIKDSEMLILEDEGHFSYMINCKWYPKLREFLLK